MKRRGRLLLVCLMFFGLPVLAQSKKLNPDRVWLEQELIKSGYPMDFRQLALKSYEQRSFETVLRLNLLGFLNPPQHMDHVTEKSVKESLEFMQKNQKFLETAEQKYKVPPAVIAALLWIETKHGENQGDFHVLSVYLHLLQADRPANRRELTVRALRENRKLGGSRADRELRQLMSERTARRVVWAREQLTALAQIHREKSLDLRALRGSFAGAFGMAQFIPSSYCEFARAAKPAHPADLTRPGDAIVSVAHYLKKHGWSNRKPASKVEALMKYNNSRDYAESILEISKRAKARKYSSHP